MAFLVFCVYRQYVLGLYEQTRPGKILDCNNLLPPSILYAGFGMSSDLTLMQSDPLMMVCTYF